MDIVLLINRLVEYKRVRLWSGRSEVQISTGQIVHNVANDSPPLRHVFERSCVAQRHNDAEMGPANLLHAWALCSEYKN